ncbi:polyprenyl synthetase family protein [Nocardia flavorosea]|uniref:polyprenyl synthetase family protein n=1 Tax=Nocardia flavorosea TaxID=53429 RepID=UPI003CC7ED65
MSKVDTLRGGRAASPDPFPSATADAAEFGQWRTTLRARVRNELETWLEEVRVPELWNVGAGDVLRQYLLGGKCLRSTFMYLGWACGAEPDATTLRAAAALELLHGFALIQDDVMDESALRRGEPAAHVRLATWHHRRNRPGSASRFGESAAILLGDMCLVWSEQMLRCSGVSTEALARGWHHYDAMRIELAVGQFADLSNDIRTTPGEESVLAIARAKSGNYTVLRPLELGARLAGCPDATMRALGAYGQRIGEAFQLRDDLLGIFGSPTITGKPEDSDLGQHKATSVVVIALANANTAVRDELAGLLQRHTLDAAAVARCRSLISQSGAAQRIEAMIDNRVEAAIEELKTAQLDRDRHRALEHMALLCTARES